MAYPQAPYPLCKIALWVGADDWEWLKARSRPLGASRVVRELIHEYRRNIEEPTPLDIEEVLADL
jgi:hypothetical protein